MDNERILYIQDYLIKNTNKKKGVTINEIQSYLSDTVNLGHVSAITIRRDINALICYGRKIEVEKGPRNTYRYKMVDKGFTFHEIKFMVDSISINKFLTEMQKKKLVKKFGRMCSDEEMRQLINRISINSVAPKSLNLLENLEKIHKIKFENRKINFIYGKRIPDGDLRYYQKNRDMAPVKVEYFNQRFYLWCYQFDTCEFRVYRVDRIQTIMQKEKITEKIPTLPKRNCFVADMFQPEYEETVILKVKRNLLDEMLEEFGRFATVHSNTETDVTLRVRAGINRHFYLWLLNYGDAIEVVAPERQRQEYLAEVKKIFEKYFQK